jgi:hypothetical protein
MFTGADGRFRLTALPGPGALFVRAVADAARFTPPTARKEDRDPAVYDERSEVFLTLGLGDIFPLRWLHAYRLIRPLGETGELTVDFGLDLGLRRQGRLLDSEGKPVAGARALGLSLSGPRYEATLPGPEFMADALNPAKPRRLLFWHEGRKLAGTVVLRGDEPEPVTVKLQPLATLTGRALLKNGEPLVGYAVECDAWPEVDWPGPARRRKGEMAPQLTDKEGRFRITDLPAGVPLCLNIFRPSMRNFVVHQENIVLEPGQTRSLGDLRGEPFPDEP